MVVKLPKDFLNWGKWAITNGARTHSIVTEYTSRFHFHVDFYVLLENFKHPKKNKFGRLPKAERNMVDILLIQNFFTNLVCLI